MAQSATQSVICSPHPPISPSPHHSTKGCILLALDGLSLNQLLGTTSISDEERSQLIAELIRMTYTDP